MLYSLCSCLIFHYMNTTHFIYSFVIGGIFLLLLPFGIYKAHYCERPRTSVCVDMFSVLGHIPWRALAKSQVALRTAFCSSPVHPLTTRLQCTRALVFPYSHQRLLLSVFFISAILMASNFFSSGLDKYVHSNRKTGFVFGIIGLLGV